MVVGAKNAENREDQRIETVDGTVWDYFKGVLRLAKFFVFSS